MRNLTHVRIEGKLYPLRKGHTWLGQDKNGSWFSYISAPTAMSIKVWMGSTYEYICATKPPKDWTKELYGLY